MIDNAVGITRDLRSGVQSYTTAEIRDDVTEFIRSARNIAAEIETGKGVAHTIIYDKKTSDDLKSLLAPGLERGGCGSTARWPRSTCCWPT